MRNQELRRLREAMADLEEQVEELIESRKLMTAVIMTQAQILFELAGSHEHLDLRRRIAENHAMICISADELQ